MKKLLVVLIAGIVFLPFSAEAQKWVEPHTGKDGIMEPGHWETPDESWRRQFSKPGTTNPLTGQFNTYGSDRNVPAPPEVKPPPAKKPYEVPGSSTPNPYAIPGSSVTPKAPQPTQTKK